MFATIYVPNFFLQAALRHGFQSGMAGQAGILSGSFDRAGETPACPTDKMSVPPVGLIDEQEKKAVIIQLNASAEAAGVHEGMTPSQGLARCLSLVIKTRSPAQEESLQNIILHYGFTLSPYVEATAPGICTIQFTDNRNLTGKVSRVIAQLGECDMIAQGGIAHTPDTSFLAAHLARPVLEIADPKIFLAPLPIETLAIGLE